jgi:hypothetical protein
MIPFFILTVLHISITVTVSYLTRVPLASYPSFLQILEKGKEKCH